MFNDLSDRREWHVLWYVHPLRIYRLPFGMAWCATRLVGVSTAYQNSTNGMSCGMSLGSGITAGKATYNSFGGCIQQAIGMVRMGCFYVCTWGLRSCQLVLFLLYLRSLPTCMLELRRDLWNEPAIPQFKFQSNRKIYLSINDEIYIRLSVPVPLQMVHFFHDHQTLPQSHNTSTPPDSPHSPFPSTISGSHLFITLNFLLHDKH